MAGLDHSIKVRLSREERAMLDRQAASERRSASSVVRFALIRYMLARDGPPFTDLPAPEPDSSE